MKSRWKEIWGKRNAERKEYESEEHFILDMKCRNGFDVVDGGMNIEAVYDQFFKMVTELNFSYSKKKIESAFEVGCGSGINLYLLREKAGVEKVGGLDYSENLIKVATDYLVDAKELYCLEADAFSTEI